MMKTFGKIILTSTILFGLVSPFVFTKSDKLLHQDVEWQYIRVYYLFNRDSTTYKVHQPRTYNGVVTDIDHYGYNAYNRKVATIKYNGDKIIRIHVGQLNHHVDRGDYVTVTEVYHPFSTEININN